jgi:hypothetical protein
MIKRYKLRSTDANGLAFGVQALSPPRNVQASYWSATVPTANSFHIDAVIRSGPKNIFRIPIK